VASDALISAPRNRKREFTGKLQTTFLFSAPEET